MSYSLLILRRAQKELGSVSEPHRSAIIRIIGLMDKNPRPAGCLKLTGRPAWRVKVGNYRIIYEIDDDARKILIAHIGHRKDVYR